MRGKTKIRLSKALALLLSASMFVGSTFSVSAETVSSGDVVSGGDALTEIVSSGDVLTPALMSLGETYADFTQDEQVAAYVFGTDVTADSVYADGVGFYNETYNDAAAGWVNNVYYPRVKTAVAGADFVKAADGSLAISSKVWTETESTGHGVYTYENTSSFAMELAPADYEVEVTFVNPTDAAYTAYVEAEDITKATGIAVAAGSEATANFIAVLVDGTLELKFLAESGATDEASAATQTVYVKKVSIVRKATEAAGTKPTIYLASDSTVQTYEKNYYPQTGWGQTLAYFFGGSVEEREADDCEYSQSQIYEAANAIVENRALGGRSSYSFIAEGKLDDLLEDIKQGDYLFIQWGHNDATAARPNRYVAPADFEQWIQYYVDGALQRGATPVLVTPVARYSYTTNADGSLNTFVGNFEAYGDVMRNMAEEQDIPLVDLTARSVAVCNNFGIEGAKSLFLHVNAGDYPEGAYAGGATDSTHLQYYGAYKFAQCVALGIQESSLLSELASKVVISIPETVPAKVEGLASGAVGATSVNMSWSAAEGAELYYIYRAEVADAAAAEAVVFDDSSTKYSVAATNKYADGSCESGKTYVYAVRGFNEKGLGEYSEKIVVTTKAAGMKFDFNYANSPTMEGWTGVNHDQMYDKAVGYGWITAPGNGRDRADNGNEHSSDMADDFALGAGEFAVDLPNGDYEVTVYAGDLLPGTSTIKMSYTAEGASLGSISVKQAIGTTTNTVRVVDGQLNIVMGGTNLYMNGMTITEILKAPSGLVDTEHAVSGNQMTFLIGFNGVDEAVSYNVYRKSTSDADFSVIKSFTVEEYEADDLACRAMIIDLGESYEYYMTCVTADGTESAQSNVITVEGVLEAAVAANAPQNVVCTSPTEDATELAREITISWDAAEVPAGTDGNVYNVIKYIIYRSEKAEDEKGFSGFEKIGESTSTSYTDKDGVATNIHYYYKVAALNAGGLSELSAACKTPITGKLVAGGLETYTDRALVAINLAGSDGGEVNVTATDADGNELTNGVYLSWRAFEADMNDNNELTTTFDVYRGSTLIADDVKVTNLVDEGGSASDTYKVVGSTDAAQNLTAIDTKVWANKYLELDLFCPADETMPDGSTCDFHANDMSVGDVDGDGNLELFVKWYPSNAKDNSGYGYTGKTYIDAYEVDFATGAAELLWRLDMGVNIRSGAHYTQFQVWDFDGDGKAEIAVKAADGTTMYVSSDGTASSLTMKDYVGACDSSALPTNVISDQHDYRNSDGFVLAGDEYFVMFNCDDGSKFEEVPYTPERGSVGAWGDSYGNRVDRFLSATAYLNGETPFAVFCRGYYTRTCLTAYYLKDTDGDNIGDTIVEYWAFDTNKAGSQYEAQGNHGLSVNDIDNDGKDEIIYGALVIDHDGTVKYSTGLGHGDAMHVSDWAPWNDGLEVMSVHEHDDATYHVEVRDAETGTILMGYNTGKDTGRGVAADIDPTSEGAEWWSIASPTYEDNEEPAWDSLNGEVYSIWSSLDNLIKLSDSTPASNASIFWDGDLLSEVQDHTFDSAAYAPTGVVIYKWNYEKEQQEALLNSSEIWSNNGTKGNVGLIADVLGDWREEIITRASADKNKVRVYSTTIQTDYVVPCLLENLAYREGVAWENVGYNQPANLSYLLSEGLVTAELGLSDVTYNSASIYFTPANDGDLYGHDIEGYEVYRKLAEEDDAAFELVATIAKADLVTVDPAASPTPAPTPSPTPEPDPVYLKYDFGSNVVKDGWTQVVSATAYSDELGYGFTDTSYNADKSYGTTFVDEEYGDVYNDSVYAGTADPIGFDVKVPNGTYEVTIFTANGTGHIYNQMVAEDVTYTDIRRGKNDKQCGYETKEVEVTDGVLNIVCNCTKSSNNGLYFNGITIKNVKYDAWLAEKEAAANPTPTPGVTTEVVKTVIYSEDFEDGASDFTLIASGNTAYEYLEKDTSTVNTNASDYVYGVGSRGGGDTGTQKSGLGITENVIFQADLKMDGCVANKSSNFAILGAANTYNWLQSDAEILTITAASTSNGYWNSITVNGVDITANANVSNGASNGESSGKGGLLRDTTGWLTVKAALNFETFMADVTITRISDGSTVYEAEVPFMDGNITTLDSVYLAAAKSYGGVFIDNVSIYTEETIIVTPAPAATPEPTATPMVEIKKTTVYSEDFEDGASDFTLIASGNTAYEYLEKDTSTVNTNASDYVYGVGSRSGGDTGTQKSGLGITENVIFQADLKMDGCVANKSSNFALLGAANTYNWLQSDAEILTISAASTNNGYWNSITVNGVDITSNANVSNGAANGESSGKGGLLRDTTGWLTVKAALDFEAFTADVIITRKSDGSTVYEAEVPFLDGSITTLDTIYLAAAKSYGGVFVDNISIWTEEVIIITPPEESEGAYYGYTDTTVDSNTTYEYKIAAIVDGKTSHMSAPLTVKTDIEIKSILDFELDSIVQDTILEDGQTVADLLPATVTVIDASDNELEADVIWDVSAVDLSTVGTYKVYGTVAGWEEKLEKDLEIIAVEVKGVGALDDVEVIQGQEIVLPEKVTVEYTNGRADEANVTWNTDAIDTNVLGTYDVTGTVDGFTATATVKVNVVADYMVSAEDVYVEVELNAFNVDEVLPETVKVTWASGETTDEAVVWNSSSVLNEVANYAILGTVEGLEKSAAGYVYMVYPAVGKFDFGITAGKSVDGWTEVTVNINKGTKTCDELGITYTTEKGYGFLDGTKAFEGRNEDFTYAGATPKEVYNDFALPAGNTFGVDVENGTYQVEILANSIYKSSVKSTVEGTALNVNNAENTYVWGSTQVEVTDGQVTVAFNTGNTSRCGAVVVREVVEALDAPPADVEPTASPEATDTPSATDAPTEAPVVTEAPTEAPVVTAAPTQAPADDDSDDDDDDDNDGVHRIVIDANLDWRQVDAIIDSIADGEDAVIEITLGKHHDLPASLVIAIKDKDITLSMVQDNGVIWEINGLDVERAVDMSLRVILDSGVFKPERLTAFDGYKVRQITLLYSGDFGFKATLRFPAESSDEGKYANLFYDNNGKFQYMGSSKITNGYSEFTFTHASDYVLVVSDNALAVKSPTTGDELILEERGSQLPMFFGILAVIAVAVLGIGTFMIKRKEEE